MRAPSTTGSVRLALGMGQFFAFAGIVMALLYRVRFFELAQVARGVGAWPLVLAYLVPLFMTFVAGMLAVRRHTTALTVGLVDGAIYGLFNGFCHWFFVVTIKHKPALVHLLWVHDMASRAHLPASSRLLLANMVYHPNVFSLTLGSIIYLACLGLVAGMVGGRVVKGRQWPS